MSKIANSVARLITLRDNIRGKLIDFGIITNESATLSDCKDAINEMVNATLTAPTISVKPTITVNSSTGIVTVSGTASGTAKLTKGYCKGLSATASVKASNTLSLTTQAAQTITPGTSNKTIAANRWLTGTQTIKGDVNLIPSNIRAGAEIFGVKGTLESAAVWSGSSKYTRSGSVLFDVGATSSGYSTYMGYVIDIYNIGFTPLIATAVGWGSGNQYLKSSLIQSDATYIAKGQAYCTDTAGNSDSGTYRNIGPYSYTTSGNKGLVLKFDSTQVSIPLWNAGSISSSSVFYVQIFGHY